MDRQIDASFIINLGILSTNQGCHKSHKICRKIENSQVIKENKKSEKKMTNDESQGEVVHGFL